MYSYKNKKPLDYYNELEKKEIEIYEETFFCDNDVSDLKELDMKNILSRKVSKFEDFDYNLPQNIFLLKTYKGKIIVGRKIRSVLRIENKINAINCSMITSPMLLGFLKSRTYSNRKISIEFYPFTCEEKKYIFNDIKDNRLLDIYYPYKYKDYYSQKEEQSPETGWSFNPEKKEYLGYGEVHFRKFTDTWFKKIERKYKTVYDPACSTGEFLSDYKRNFPTSYTIGHDLSQEMIEYAKNYVDEYCCCNAIDSPLKNSSVDLMFLRFLNSEVVTTKDAYKLIKVLIKKVRKSGLIVCFGHTPVLIRKEMFQKFGLKPVICNGYDKDRNAIFQYYVFEVK
jgi:isonocardicin synthase